MEYMRDIAPTLIKPCITLVIGYYHIAIYGTLLHALDMYILILL